MAMRSDGDDAVLSSRLRSKRPSNVLAGPYGHPFHPILVTIPIGAWISSVVFDIIGFFAEDSRPFVVGAMVLIVIGLVGAVLAAVFGVMDLSHLAAGTPARRVALIHMSLNLGAVVLMVVGLIVRVVSSRDDVSIVGFVLSVVVLIAIGISGWLGGKLAYRYGVRVADETTQAEGFR